MDIKFFRRSGSIIALPAQASDGKYGAQIWLSQANEYSSVPRESYYADGFGGQKILIIPSKNLVITVLSGQQHDLDFNLLFQRIIGCLIE